MPPAPAWKEKPLRMMPATRRKSATYLCDQEAIGRAGDLRGAGDDLRGIADGWDFDHVVNIVALDLPGNAGERNEVVGDDDDLVGVHRVGEREAERTAGGLAVEPLALPKISAVGAAMTATSMCTSPS